MINETGPYETVVTAKVGFQPHFPGTIHDNATAPLFGYRSALVPGIYIYGYMANLVAYCWGMPWVEHGSMRANSRRPVYDGDLVHIHASAVRRDDAGLSVDFRATDAEGNVLSLGQATLPRVAPQPPAIHDFPMPRPIPAEPPPIDVDKIRVGQDFGTKRALMNQELFDSTNSNFQQTWPYYRENGIVHPSYGQQLCARNSMESYAYSTPGIHASGWGQHFAAAKLGDEITTRGRITKIYEKNGNHYYEDEHLVVANDTTVIALMGRAVIYRARTDR